MVFTNMTTSSPQPSSQQNDDISVFLRQVLHHRSSPSSSSVTSQPFISASSSVTPMGTHAPNHNTFNNNFTTCYSTHQHHQLNSILSGSDRLVVDRISNDPLNDVVLPSESLEFHEDNNFDSEEREEVVVEEVETKQQTSRNQSKRSRAAEVHNLSEKRRRSRINEKMKALQNLIPNSNKTDKASMLDEAIEYLKQLQLQVQMLSLRNGMSLHPMCVPGGLNPSQLSQMGIKFESGSGSYDINLTNVLSTTHTETSNTMLNIPNQCPSFRPSLPVPSTIIDSVPLPFDRESCMPANFGPFQLQNSQALRGELGMAIERSVDNIKMESSVTAFSRPEQNPIERIPQNLEPQETLPENVSAQNQLISSNFTGLLAKTSGAQMTR